MSRKGKRPNVNPIQTQDSRDRVVAELTCAECGRPFPFTAGEQAYYSERGFRLPKRCKTCRDASRASHAPFPSSS